MINFRTLRLAMDFFEDCEGTKVPRYLRNQLRKLSRSVIIPIYGPRFLNPDLDEPELKNL
jgi:hypothetical protein